MGSDMDTNGILGTIFKLLQQEDQAEVNLSRAIEIDNLQLKSVADSQPPPSIYSHRLDRSYYGNCELIFT